MTYLIDKNSSKIIPPLVSLGCLLSADTQHNGATTNGRTPQNLGWIVVWWLTRSIVMLVISSFTFTSAFVLWVQAKTCLITWFRVASLQLRSNSPFFPVNVYGVSTLATAAIQNEMYVSHFSLQCLTWHLCFMHKTLPSKGLFSCIFLSRTILVVIDHISRFLLFPLFPWLFQVFQVSGQWPYPCDSMALVWTCTTKKYLVSEGNAANKINSHKSDCYSECIINKLNLYGNTGLQYKVLIQEATWY